MLTMNSPRRHHHTGDALVLMAELVKLLSAPGEMRDVLAEVAAQHHQRIEEIEAATAKMHEAAARADDVHTAQTALEEQQKALADAQKLHAALVDRLAAQTAAFSNKQLALGESQKQAQQRAQALVEAEAELNRRRIVLEQEHAAKVAAQADAHNARAEELAAAHESRMMAVSQERHALAMERDKHQRDHEKRMAGVADREKMAETAASAAVSLRADYEKRMTQLRSLAAG